MHSSRRDLFKTSAAIAALGAMSSVSRAAEDPLPSWNDGPAKKAILDFVHTPKLLLNDNFSGKPEDIYLFLGRHPKAAFGNSTGDQQMLEYAQAGGGATLMMMVLHDDADREYAYGPATDCLTPKSVPLLRRFTMKASLRVGQ